MTNAADSHLLRKDFLFNSPEWGQPKKFWVSTSEKQITNPICGHATSRVEGNESVPLKILTNKGDKSSVI